MDELDRAGAAVRAHPIAEPTPVESLRRRVNRRVRRRHASVALAVACALAIPAIAVVDARTKRSVVVHPVDNNHAMSPECLASSAASADVDGDGRPDRVYLMWNGSAARLGVCTGAGKTDEVDCTGQAEGPVAVVSLPEQPAVILCGGTSVSELFMAPFVWKAGALHPAPLPAPDQPAFRSGRIVLRNVEQYGCPKIGSRRLLAQLTIARRGSSWTWTRRAYAFTAAGARLVNTSTGRLQNPSSQQVRTLVPTCPTTSPPGTNPRLDPVVPAATPPPLSRALDLQVGTLFGFKPGPDTGPDAVRAALEPILGPPTRDTGWYETTSTGPEDCLGDKRARVVRWGNVSYAFWHSNVDVLWSWTLGDSKASGDGDRKEPPPIVEQPAVHATTPDGFGVGTPIAVLQRELGDGVQMYDNRQEALLPGGVMVSLARGLVTGFAGRLSFC
jgi:hypothetical protein